MAALALLGSACGRGAFPSPAEVELGYGLSSFNAISDGEMPAVVPIIMGLQGGYHIWGAVRARYVDPSDVSVVFTLTRSGDATPFSIRHDHVDLDGADDGFALGRHLGSAVFLPDVMAARDHPCLWQLDLTDGSGRHASSHRLILPTGP